MLIKGSNVTPKLLQSLLVTARLVRGMPLVRPLLFGNQSTASETADERFKSSEASENWPKSVPMPMLMVILQARLWPISKVTSKLFNGNFECKKLDTNLRPDHPLRGAFFCLCLS